MSKKNPLSDYDREMNELAIGYEQAQDEHTTFFLDVEQWAELANWYCTSFQEKLALEVIDKGLSVYPDNNLLLIEKANIYIDCQKFKKAWEIVNMLDDHYSSASKVLRARLLIRDGAMDEAALLLHDDSGEEVYPVEAASMYIQAGYPEIALEWLENEETHEDDESYKFVLATCYQSMEQYDKAIELYNTLLDINPYSSTYWHNIGQCYFQKGMYDKAVEAYDYAIVSDEENGMAYVGRGDAYVLLGNDKQALEDYENAYRLNSFNASELNAQTITGLMVEDHWEDTIAMLQFHLSHRRMGKLDRAKVYLTIGMCYMNLNENKHALLYMREAAALNPRLYLAHINMGYLYLVNGDEEKADEIWTETVKTKPKSTKWELIGIFCLKAGKLDRAIHAFEKAKAANKKADVDGFLACLYLVKGNMRKFKSLNKHMTTPISESVIKQYMGISKDASSSQLAQAIYEVFQAAHFTIEFE